METSQEAEIYDPDGLLCGDCGRAWQPTAAHASRACPDCRSANVIETYPEIPTLDHDPGLALILAVEGQIPRSEGGGILFREMVAWLRFHGVRDRAEILTWEWFFREIGRVRSAIVEELTAPAPQSTDEAEAD